MGFKMKISEIDLGEKAIEAIQGCLSGIPIVNQVNIKKEPGSGRVRPDLLVDLEIVGPKKEKLVIEVKNNGQPRYAREAVNQILRYREMFPNSYGIFVAPFISDRAGEICSESQIGYIDFSGNCRLCFNQIYIEKEGKPNIYAKKRDFRSLFSSKRTRVIRVLLSNPKNIWKIQELSNESEVSLGQTSNIKKLLTDREWLQIVKGGFSLKSPGELLKEWGENYSFRKNTIRNFYSLDGIPEIEEQIANVCSRKQINYALTGFSGATRLYPNVRYKNAMVYIENLTDELILSLNFKPVNSGANVNILLPYDAGVFYGLKIIDGIQIASPIQIYLDLLSYRGRGEEAAESLFDEVIKTEW